MDIKAAAKTLLVALAAGTFCLSALAQWQWVDKDGRKVFSDRSPPAEIPEKNILKRPAGSVPPRAVEVQPVDDGVSETPPTPVARASAPKLSGKDVQLEAKKKQAEDDEAAKKRAEEERITKARIEGCARAKQDLATLQSGVRLASVNAKGERQIYDDAKRAEETKRAQESIAASCK
ncbi:MAG: DUF4124 domain-containing protein [Polaromonas sp.]|nr:DUF4124 domain-containing protein [Polaromonas sp.]